MIKTGIRFFDKNGGFAENDKILIKGPTGIGKKMLAYYLINNWIKRKKNVILINADGNDERIIKIFKKYFKTDVHNYPNFIIINAYKTKMGLERIKRLIKGIRLKEAIIVFDSLTGYFFNNEKIYLYKRNSKKKEVEAVEAMGKFCIRCRHPTIIIANNELIDKEAVKKLEKNATIIIEMWFEEEKGRLRRKMKVKTKKWEDETRFMITHLGLKI